MTETRSPYLRTGEEFKQSLRDGRKLWVEGREIPDVTAEPALGAGIDMIGEMFDDQFSEEHQDVVTMVDSETGHRVSRAWQVPTNVAELQERRKLIEYTSLKTVGTYGRPPDLAPLVALGLLAHKPLFAKSNPEFARNNQDFAENIGRYFDYSKKNNLIAAEVLADPQNDRSGPSGATAGLLRVTSQEKDGIRISGAKSVGSIAAQADEILFTNLLRPDFPPEACLWAALPTATEGIKMICRPPVSSPGSNAFDHPIAHRGEEADQFIVFDNAFVPNDRIFNLGDPSLLKYYGSVTVWAHWHILTRLQVKSEVFIGAAQLVMEALGTQKFPAVRAQLADLIEYSQALKAFILAAENTATMTEGGVLAPNMGMLTAGRLYSISNYPKIIHILQEICGQGLVMRFSRNDFDHSEIGPLLDALLPGHGISAREKNRLMNFVWDLTTDSLAGRVELFENVNATPAPFLRERLFNEFPREQAADVARDLAGLEY